MRLKHKHRLFILKLVFLIIFILIWVQLFNIQISKSTGLISQAKKQFFQEPIILRGDIRDRDGNLLVLDIVTYEVYNNTRNVEKISQDRLDSLAKLLELKLDELKTKLSKTINTKIISTVNEHKSKIITKLYSDLVYTRPRVKRVYPHNKMAGHVLGFVNADHKAQHGVEYFHENLLTKLNITNRHLDIFPKGTTIVLTIDSVLQEYAEEELTGAIKKTKADKGTIIIMSPKTGEIYAWAVYPTLDPNNYFKEMVIKNWSITDVYEPGSTFKVITVASALENMTISAASTFFDPGFIKIGKRIIKNHHKNKPQNINLLELFKQSSNVAAAQVALTMKIEEFHDTIQKIMIGQKTNIDLPGESGGLLLEKNKWKKLDLATTAFGQGAVSVTPLQLACAISAIANHGIWVQPHLLKGIWEPQFETVYESPYNPTKEQVISCEVADLISSLLKQSVKENLETMAYIAGNVPGYEVGGKTGTAQKIRPDGKGYLSGNTVASFIGYLPADDPEILALVVIDNPKALGGWGNTVCGPIFNDVAKLAAKRVIEG